MKAHHFHTLYDAGVPSTLRPYPDCTLLDVVRDSARQRPDHPALLFKGARLTYASLERQSDAFAAALAALGVQKGDRVALLVPNCPQAVIAQLGVWKAGAIAAPINPLYTEHELRRLLTECGATLAVVLTPFYTKVKAVQPETAIRRVIATNIKSYLPPILRLLFTAFRERREGHRITVQPGDIWLRDLLRQYAHAPAPDVRVGPHDPALLLFTGGTTGMPKGAVGTHHALWIAAQQLHAWFQGELVDWDDVILLLMPLFHVYGNVGVLATALVGHNPVALVPNPRDLDDVIATIRTTHPAFVPGVPTLFLALLNYPAVQAGTVDFRSIKLSISGAAPLPAETRRRFETLTGGRMIEGYALTESLMATVAGPVHGVNKPGAIGLPLPDVELRIVDTTIGQSDLPPGEVGEILLRAPQLMQGYWQRPAETASMLRNGWLYTEDLGYCDADGYLYLVDRKKDVIKPSGFQVWPSEVEAVIAAHPAVAEVAVAGVPDPLQGEAVKAWVVLRAGQQLSADELRVFCREQLAAYKVPKQIAFRDSLPKTVIGKVLRRELAHERGVAQEV